MTRAQRAFLYYLGALALIGDVAHELRNPLGPVTNAVHILRSKPAPDSQELTLVARYENVSVDNIRQATGWPLAIADNIEVVASPTADELRVLRDLHKRTQIAHAGDVLRSRKIPRPLTSQVNA